MPVGNKLNISELVRITQLQLSGYANAVTQQDLLVLLNKAKDRVWALLRTLEANYFVQVSDAATTTALNYFAPLTTTNRSYTLPPDCHEVRFLEITTAGFEDTRFIYRDISHPDFQTQRRDANADQGTNSPTATPYYYTIIGKTTFLLAKFPEAAMTAVLYYVRTLPDFEMNDDLDEILNPISKCLADFATKQVMIMQDDSGNYDDWEKEWKSDVLVNLSAESPRDTTGPVFAQEFEG